jgi:hypothetical protein
MKSFVLLVLVFFAGIATGKVLQLPGATSLLVTPVVAATLVPIQLHQEKAICPSPATSRPSYYYLGGPDIVRYECFYAPEYLCPPGFTVAYGGPRDFSLLGVPGSGSAIRWTCQQVKVARN